MKNKLLLTGCYIAALIIVLAYKFLVHQEPWVIGMARVIFLSIFLTLTYFLLLYREKTRTVIKEFFNGEDSPVNIAFFRIIFFGYLFFLPMTKEVVWFSSFPKELQFAPMGMGWILPWLPINPSVAYAACLVFKISCFLGMIGFLTRFSTVLAAIFGFYVIGIPQFYGNVAHNHHLFWFLLIFSVSRCADTLSIDAVINSLNRAKNNDLSVPKPSRRYALPLRFIWILIGLCYFFPGFWKFWNAGTEWILGDNLRQHMYFDWMGFDQWLPPIRIDQYPWLCRPAAVFAIFFELNFIFFIFSRSLRYVAAFEGLFFHNMTKLLMNIDFYDLQICYVSFFNWDQIFRKLGKKLFSEEMTILFDGSCSFCRKVIAFIKVFDVFGRITYLDLHGTESRSLLENKKFSQEDLMKDMHSVIGSRVLKGFDSYKAISERVPLFWLLRPFLGLGFVQTIGNNIYRNVADHRACKLVPKVVLNSSQQPASNKILVITALILIASNVIFGFMGKGSGWPFACYPTFSEIPGDLYTTIDCQIIYPDSTEKTVHLQSLKSHTGSYRIVGLVSKLLSIKNEQIRQEKFLALWNILAQVNPDLKGAKTIRFYFIESYANPDKWPLNPVNKKLAAEIKFDK